VQFVLALFNNLLRDLILFAQVCEDDRRRRRFRALVVVAVVDRPRAVQAGVVPVAVGDRRRRRVDLSDDAAQLVDDVRVRVMQRRQLARLQLFAIV